MRVMVLAPHPDDEAIGCGGTLLLHAARGDDVHVVFLTSGELGCGDVEREQAWRIREAEARAAAAILDVDDLTFLRRPDWGLSDDPEAVGVVAELVSAARPEVIYVPHAGEWHPDHKAAHAIAFEAARRAAIRGDALRTYEVWTPLGEWDVAEDVTDVMPRKLEAIRCYPSQLSAFDYVQAATGLAGYRGALTLKTSFAEVFDRGAVTELAA